MQNYKPKFQFISSYRGGFDYGFNLPNGESCRLSIRGSRDEYDEKYSTLSADDWERQVNGKLGLASIGRSELLTEELIVEFNRQSFFKWQSEANFMKANPQKYGSTYEPEPFKVYVGGRYDLKEKRWEVLHDFESVRVKAGIPLELCCDPRRNMGQLKLVA
jgi:hypothetical protein